MPPGTQQSTCPRCASVNISMSVTSSMSSSDDGTVREKAPGESSKPVKGVKAFRVSSLNSAAEQRKFAMTIML